MSTDRDRALFRRVRAVASAPTVRRAQAVGLRLAQRLWDLDQPKLWALSLGVGVLAGYGAVGFVVLLELLHWMVYGGVEANLVDAVRAAPVWVVLGAPIVGGLIVGLLFHRGCGGAAPMGVADVIEARALKNAMVEPRRGAISVWAAAVSLGFGASGGREGPAVLLGATIASMVSERLKLTPLAARTLLGCAVAAAVSASFNAPIAGALFALEVVLGHYAVRAFAPITIASVAGAVISRAHLGDAPAFALPFAEFGSYSQFPAFALLGLVSAATAAAMMWSIFVARTTIDQTAARIGAPTWLHPAMAGAVLGVTALAFPHIVAVGYQTTTEALASDYGFWTCVLFVVVKTFAVAVTLGGRFAGGVFSPALMLGALVGSAFGSVAIDVFPSVAGSQALYALAGMGAVAGAVLGAPISTTLIVFELTRDYGTAIAVMVSTSVATVAVQQTLQKSFFHWQLTLKNIDLSAGPQTYLLPALSVSRYMRPRGDDTAPSETAAWALVEQGARLEPTDTLARAFPMFQSGRMPFVPVVESKAEGQGVTLIGTLHYVDALRAYNRALVETHEEEHS